MFQKAKILFIGPCESGKTVLANFLADATEASTGVYRPTQGVRILEFEIDGINADEGNSSSVEVELWDCSGNHGFEMCWPAMQRETNGVVFVCNPGKANHEKELQTWYLHFAKELGIKDQQCIVFSHARPGVDDQEPKKLGGSLSRLKMVKTSLENDPDAVRKEFRQFLLAVLTSVNDKRDREELSIIE